jgi:hypothetical protein
MQSVKDLIRPMLKGDGAPTGEPGQVQRGNTYAPTGDRVAGVLFLPVLGL